MSAFRSVHVWDYFSKADGEIKVANCNKCSKKLSYRTSITNLKTHLKLKHRKDYFALLAKSEQTRTPTAQTTFPELVAVKSKSKKNTPKPSSSSEGQDNCEEESIDFDDITKTTNKIITASPIKKSCRKEDKKNIDAMLLKFIVKTNQPFSIVDEQNFMGFVEALNPNYTMPTRELMSSKLIPCLYQRCLEEQSKILQQEAVTVCMTTDCWTNSEMNAFVSITAHFINNDFQLKSVVLKCSEINEVQTSQSIASILSQASTEWGISDKINFCVTDNAENMVSAINILGWTHYGCIAHKLNLTMQNSLILIDDILRKVKTIVHYYRSNQKAEEKLLEYQTLTERSSQPLTLIKSVVTRWISTYVMIERFVTLQNAVKATMIHLDNEQPAVSNEEWTALKQLCKILTPFNEAAKELSAEKYVSASKATAVINGLKDVLEEIKKKPYYYDAITHVVECIESELNTQFYDLEYQDSLAMCTILDPRYKMSMFIDENVARNTKLNLATEVAEMIKAEAGPANIRVAKVECQLNEGDAGEVSLWRKRNLVLEERRTVPNQNYQALAQQEVETYMQDEYAESTCDPCQWWRSSQYKYPHLAELFKIKCNIVATSVPSETLFLKAGYHMSERRTRLSAKKTEQVVFLNANLSDCDYTRFMLL